MAKANKEATAGQDELPTGTGTGTSAEQLQADGAGASGEDGEIEQEGGADPLRGVAAAQPLASGLIRALVLRDCGYGTAGTVVSLATSEVETGVEQGALDPNGAAVAAAGG